MPFGVDDALVLGGLGADVLGGGLGAMFGDDDRERQRRLWEQLKVPELERLNPETVGQSDLSGYQEDPRLRAAKYNALAKLRGIEDSGGLTLEDKAAQNEALTASGRAQRAGFSRIRDDAAGRGGLNNGSTLAMQLAHEQESNDQAARTGLSTAGAAQRRMFDAMRERASLAGQMSSQEFGQASQKAAAKDAINQYNAGARARAAQYNAGLGQQDFYNRMAKTQGASGYYGGEADRKAGQWSGMGSAVGGGLIGYADMRQRRQQRDPWGDYGEGY